MKNLYTFPKRYFNVIVPLGLIIFGVSSCTVSQTATKPNDGIYYDPSQEPEQEIVYTESQTQEEASTYDEPIRIGGKYFDDAGNAPTYEEDPVVYQDNNTVVIHGYDDYDSDYILWGDEGETQVNINHNYYGSAFYSPFYNPYFGSYFSFWRGYRFGLGFGFSSFYGDPYYPAFYYPYRPFYGGFGYPYYGYVGHYGPYYSPYGYNGYHPNRFYNNPYVRKVTRGKGNQNSIATSRGSSNIRPSVADGIRRSDKVLKKVTTQTTKSQNHVRNNSVKRRSSDKVRVRQSDDNRVRPSRGNNVLKETRTPRVRRSTGNRTYSKPRTTRPRTTAPRPRQNKTSKVQKKTNNSNNTTYRTPTPSYNRSTPSPSRSTTGSRNGIRRD